MENEFQIIFPQGWEWCRISNWLQQRNLTTDRERFKGGYNWHVIYYCKL